MKDHLQSRFVGDTELPFDEGQPQGPDVRDKDVDPVGRKADYTLTGLAGSHCLFQPALIRAAGLVTDPVSLCWAENNLPANEAPYLVHVGWDAFHGVPSPENQLVLACPLVHAKVLIPALARAQFGVPGRITWEAVHQRLEIVDRKLLSTLTHQPSRPPTVTVDVFGLSGPNGTYLWKPPTDPWTQGLQLIFRHPQKKTRRPFSGRSTSSSSPQED